MNTLGWMAAAGAVQWLAFYCFNTLGQVGLGIVIEMAFGLCVAMTLLAAKDDFNIMFGEERGGRE